MKRLIFIFLAVTMGMNSHEISGRVLVEPDILTFRKTWQIPGMSAQDIYYYIDSFAKMLKDNNWKYGIDPKGGRYSYNYSRFFYDIDLSGRRGELSPELYLRCRNGEFELILTEIFVAWSGGKCVFYLSTIDDRFNRPALWRLFHSKKVLDAARARSAELFEELTAAMDEYLKYGPPIEMKEM